jgi:hypothetical protein
LDEFVNGYKKEVAMKRHRGVMQTNEGKAALPFAGYSEIALILATLTPEHKKYSWAESMFGWVFQVLSWNCMARCNSIGTLMCQHLNWVDDCLVITLSKHKGDQTGESEGREKHVYANPTTPHICPILALAVYVFSTNRKRDSNLQLFEGAKADERFPKILKMAVEKLPHSFSLGAQKEDIGTHSNRKGSASYALNLSSSVNAAQVYLRAGWSLGNVPDRYIYDWSSSMWATYQRTRIWNAASTFSNRRY